MREYVSLAVLMASCSVVAIFVLMSSERALAQPPQPQCDLQEEKEVLKSCPPTKVKGFVICGLGLEHALGPDGGKGWAVDVKCACGPESPWPTLLNCKVPGPEPRKNPECRYKSFLGHRRI